jgi:acyl carrier protein
MIKSEIIAQLQAIFRDVLDNDAILLADHTTASDVEDWDSLTHIQLIVAIEKHFRLKLDSREILSWNTVGEMADALVKRLGS